MQKTTKKGRMSKIYSLSPDCIFSIKEIAAHCKCSESYALEMAMEKALNWYRKKWAREEWKKDNDYLFVGVETRDPK